LKKSITDHRVLAYAAATIGRESSWNPRAVNTTDAAAKTGYPGAGLAQITWKDNYVAVGKATDIDFIGKPALMFDPYHALRAKAAFYHLNQMIPFIQAGDYQSAAGIYNAGRASFRSDYTQNVAADTAKWLIVFKELTA
jgi:predicted chitinase